MPNIRHAVLADLDSILELYSASDVSAAAQPDHRAGQIWESILTREGVTVFVSEYDNKIVASCVLITSPNLLRGGRQHAFLENVVTHPKFQRQGHGRAVVQAALTQAWSCDCHHVLLQSGRDDPNVHRFYKDIGFEPGLRTAYVAHRPVRPEVRN